MPGASMAISGGLHTFTIWLDIISKASTVVGVIMAILGGWIALQSYRANVRNAANSLIHTLFKDYLMLRVDFGEQSPGIAAVTHDDDSEPPLEQVAGIKLYVLEEMFYWTEREQRTLNRLKTFMGRVEWRNREAAIESWRSTIRYHTRQDRNAVRDNLFDYTTCYGVQFLRFIADDWNERELSQLVASQEHAVLNSTPRPLGHREGNPSHAPARKAPVA